MQEDFKKFRSQQFLMVSRNSDIRKNNLNYFPEGRVVMEGIPCTFYYSFYGQYIVMDMCNST